MDNRYQVQYKDTFGNGLHHEWNTCASFDRRKEARAYIDGATSFAERPREFRIYDTKLDVEVTD